jgi:hypothetical protein
VRELPRHFKQAIFNFPLTYYITKPNKTGIPDAKFID